MSQRASPSAILHVDAVRRRRLGSCRHLRVKRASDCGDAEEVPLATEKSNKTSITRRVIGDEGTP